MRVRRIKQRLPIGRLYEVELTAPDGEVELTSTRSPLTILEPTMGVGDAWAVIHAADRAWDGSTGKWAGLYTDDNES